MTPKNPARESYFPLIEKRYGEPMAYWHRVMKELKSEKYPEQITFLRENHGFSQAHANALVMFSRGSLSTQKFETVKEYFDSITEEQAKTLRKVFRILSKYFPESSLVIAWNKPMLKIAGKYIFGAATTKNYILIAPFSTAVLEKLSPALTQFKVNKKTFAVPNNWVVDEKLLVKIVKNVISETF
jgi:uncharacterized protein YdhG (YjbR/CyaY superfamily)